MQQTSGPPTLEPEVQALLDDFAADPSDARVFAMLEEQLFLAGAWQELAVVYGRRLTLLAEASPERANVLLRLGGLCEERLGNPRDAMRRYQQLLADDPHNTQALARLRRTYVALGEVASALQIAEFEEQIERPPREQARALTEIADMWRGLGETSEASRRLELALQIDPVCDAALCGLARLAQDAGDRGRAVALLEQRLHTLKGSARTDALEDLARVLDDDVRVREILTEVVRSRSHRPWATRRLITLEHAYGDRDAARRLLQRLWMKVQEPEERLRLALESATEALGGSAPPDTVQFWLNEAGEVGGDDPRVHELRARLFRRAGRPEGLIQALEALNRTEGYHAMRQLEIAVLYEREDQPERAVEAVQALLEREPSDRDGLALLDRCLERAGRHGERVEVLERRIQLADDDTEHARLSVCLGDVLREQLDDAGAAEEVYRRALARDASNRDAASRLKELYLKLERLDELDAFLEGAASRAATPEARASELCELGRMRLELRRDPAGARSAFLAALETEPGCHPALDGLRSLGAERPDAPAAPPAPPEPDRAPAPAPEPIAAREPAAAAKPVAPADLAAPEPAAAPPLAGAEPDPFAGIETDPFAGIEPGPLAPPEPAAPVEAFEPPPAFEVEPTPREPEPRAAQVPPVAAEPEPPAPVAAAERPPVAPCETSKRPQPAPPAPQASAGGPDPDHLRSLIAAARSAGDLGRALQVAERWVEQIGSGEAHLTLAALAREAGDAVLESAALEGLCTLLEAEPAQQAAALERLAELALERQGPEAVDRALQLYRDALALAPGPRLRGVVIELCQGAGRTREAADLLLAQLADPQWSEPPGPLRVRLAHALCQIGAREEAIEVLRVGLAQDPSGEVADRLEGLLAEDERLQDLAGLLARRLERERDPARRRELAHRLGGVLLDGLERPDDAVAVLRELADPSRTAPLEELFERALDAGGSSDELATWLAQREAHLDGQARIDAQLRLATLQQRAGHVEQAIGTLRRGAQVAPREQLEAVGRPLLHMLRQFAEPDARLEVLAHLAAESPDREARRAFTLERARLLIDELGRREEGLAALDALDDPAGLPGAELRQLAGLCARAGAPERQAAALEALGARRSDTQVSVAARRELAGLLARGPEAVRDPDRAGALVEELVGELEDDPDQQGELLALLEQIGDRERLAGLLEARLARRDLPAEERSGLALRLAELHQKHGDPESALEALRSARSQGAGGEAVDEALFRALEAGGDAAARVELCAQKAQASRDAARECWLRRWLAGLIETRAPAETRLAVVEELLGEVPHDADLVERRVRLLRALDRRETLARALEALLRDHPPSRERRRLVVRELLRLYEGPLRTPERALLLIERELAGDPSLRTRGLRLAAALGDAEREARLLAPLLEDGSATPEQQRRLGIVLARVGQHAKAEPLLWKALERDPSDVEALRALEGLVRAQDEPTRLLRLLEARFVVEDAAQRARIAEEALGLSDRARDPEAGLRWIRRWHAADSLPRPIVERWIEMERGLGDRHGLFTALRLLRQLADGDDENAAVLTQEAALHAASGQLELAREAYEQALRLTPQPPCEWLAALDRILATQGRVLRRSGVLRDLTRHPELSPAERERYREVRADLLASHPDLREEAAAELEQLIADDRRADDDVRVARMRTLLDLYAELERIADWCRLAERLCERLAGDERLALERSLARRRTRHLFAREDAVAGWRRILEARPDDREALEALCELLRFPGAEAQRAAVLERLAKCETPGRPERWVEAARVRWNLLGDARGALTDLDAALALDAAEPALHELRAEICARLGRAREEAASLRALLEADPGGADAAPRWLRLAELAAPDAERRAEAREALEHALAAGAERPGLRRAACALLQQIREWERACELLRAELEVAPAEDRGSLLAELSRIEWDERRRAEPACEVFAELEGVRELEPEELDRWADALGALDRWPEALERRRDALTRLGNAVGAPDWLELADLALEKCDDASAARAACDRALERDPRLLAALELSVELWEREGASQQQLDALVALAERHPAARAAADAYSEAARIASELLGDEAHAWALYRKALGKEPGQRSALLGAGRIALARREWSEAERMFAMALALQDGVADDEVPYAEVARLAAEAALSQQRNAEALHYLEQSLAAAPNDPSALDAMAQLSQRLGVHTRARQCLEQRLEDPTLEDGERADRLFRLAQACEASGESERAVHALERAVGLRPEDTVTRARLVDLLEKLERRERAVAELDGWIEHAPAEERPALGLRAARLELRLGRTDAARQRLAALSARDDAGNDVWVERARLALDLGEPDEAASVASEGLARTRLANERGPLLWLRTLALFEQGRSGEAARSALETLEADLTNLQAAEVLARNLGRVGEFRPAVALLERFLDANRPPADVEAELWEAVGRAYAGPLENMERAERCYRRALDANPQHASAREALADITAFDPAAHSESVHLHRELLDGFPARPGSWRAIAQIAEHWRRERAHATCLLVLEALRVGGEESEPRAEARPLIHTGASENGGVQAATELLSALNETNRLPDVAQNGVDHDDVPIPLRVQLAELAGPGWDLTDDQLVALWRRPLEESLLVGDGLSRRRRRELQRALKEPNAARLRTLEPGTWREELLAQAAARAVDQGALSLGDALRALLAVWPSTADLDLDHATNRAEAVQLCPPAQNLLMRVADTTLGSLGLA